jgi:hypothetical protein
MRPRNQHFVARFSYEFFSVVKKIKNIISELVVIRQANVGN